MEKSISVLEQRERSQSAMRSLYSVAHAQYSEGIEGALPREEILTAKEFFYNWKRRKFVFENIESNAILMIPLMIAYILFFFTADMEMGDVVFFVVFLAVLEFVFFLMEDGKSKRTYIKEMLGDLSHLSSYEKDLFLRGLLFELWRVEQKYKVKSIIFFNVVIVAGLALSLFLSTHNQNHTLGLIVAIFGVFGLGIAGFIDEKRVKEAE